MNQLIYTVPADFQWGNGANCCVCVISNLSVQAGTGKEILLRFVAQKYPKILEIEDVRQAGPNFVLFSENAWKCQDYAHKTNEKGEYIANLKGPDEFGAKFADAIEEAKLGEVYRSPKVINYLHHERFNHPPGDRVFIWTVDHSALREWYRENQEKPIENAWETITAQVAEADKVQAAREPQTPVIGPRIIMNAAQPVWNQARKNREANAEAIKYFLDQESVLYARLKKRAEGVGHNLFSNIGPAHPRSPHDFSQ